MADKVSSFVRSNKPWILKKVFAEYLRANNMFSNLDRENQREVDIPFVDLKKLSELVFSIKEDLHLIYKRMVDPQKRIFERAAKYTPNEDEIEFINNVGLIFHKVTVARELKYVMEHYAVDSDDYAETKSSYDTYWLKVRSLFSDGIDMLKKLLSQCSDNKVILCYLIQNDRYIYDTLGESVHDILMQRMSVDHIDSTYVEVGKYCIESGWNEVAKKIVGEALKINPVNTEAKELFRCLTHEESEQVRCAPPGQIDLFRAE